MRGRAALWPQTGLLCLLALASPAGGQERAPERGEQLRSVESDLRAAEERRRALEAEAESIRTDRARLNAALIDTGARMRDAETRMAEIEKRLDVAAASEDAIRKSLEARRDVLADILAALQRMGRRQPPAVLASPDDALRAVRAAILLGSVLPDMRNEAQALASDLADLVNLRHAIAEERAKLAQETQTVAHENERLAALVEARQSALKEAEQKVAAEKQRARELARQATDLKELIARSEAELAASARAAEEARLADEAQKKNPKVAAPFSDPARLSPQIAFADAKGMLPMPVAGRILKTFGASDGLGSTEKGLSLAARPGAAVAAPCDGWVAFSGPYRSYGQLLILNAGGGYYVVLAGMDRISVDVGQFVLAGEPVATMGEGSAIMASAYAASGQSAGQPLGAPQPILYVEFRKDGAAIDPSPWWAKAELEKVRG